jgi:hypothetical protein
MELQWFLPVFYFDFVAAVMPGAAHWWMDL